MTIALLDPWTVTPPAPDSTDDEFSKLRALADFFGRVLADRPLLEVVGFLSDDQHRAFREWFHSFKRADRATFARWYYYLLRSTDGVDSASIEGAPADLDRSWLEVLWEVTRPGDRTAWRDPILFVPGERATVWPKSPEVTVRAHGTQVTRSLVLIETCDQHPHYHLCFDPWLYDAPAETERLDEEARKKLRRLPRPLEITKQLKLVEWSPTLEAVVNPYPTDDEHQTYFYIPPQGWDPEPIRRDEWLTRRCFPTAVKYTPRARSGPLDRNGCVWEWDIEEHHWDVQHPDSRKTDDYVTVSTDGRVLKRVER